MNRKNKEESKSKIKNKIIKEKEIKEVKKDSKPIKTEIKKTQQSKEKPIKEKENKAKEVKQVKEIKEIKEIKKTMVTKVTKPATISAKTSKSIEKSIEKEKDTKPSKTTSKPIPTQYSKPEVKVIETKKKNATKRKDWKKIDVSVEDKTTSKKLQKKVDEIQAENININDFISFDTEKRELPKGFLGKKTEQDKTSLKNRKHKSGYTKLLNRQINNIETLASKTKEDSKENLMTLGLKESVSNKETSEINDIWGGEATKKLKQIPLDKKSDFFGYYNKEESRKPMIKLPVKAPLPLPHPGLSYNPTVDDSKRLITSIANLNKEVLHEKKFFSELLIKPSERQREKKVVDEEEDKNEDDSSSEEDEESEDEEEGEDEEEEVDEENKHKHKRPLTKTERNKKRQRRLNKLKNMDDYLAKQQKKVIHEIQSSKKFEHEKEKQEKLRKAKEEKQQMQDLKKAQLIKQGAVIE